LREVFEKVPLTASNKGFLMRQVIHKRKMIPKSLSKFCRAVQIVPEISTTDKHGWTRMKNIGRIRLIVLSVSIRG
jgi:hypothetical protein